MIGQPVLSVAGRDKNRVFVVVEILDANYVAIADGGLRKIKKPKRKKLKHLRILNTAAIELPCGDKELAQRLKAISQS